VKSENLVQNLQKKTVYRTKR